MTLCPGFKSLPALVSSSPFPAVSLLPKPHTKAYWITRCRLNCRSGLASSPWVFYLLSPCSLCSLPFFLTTFCFLPMLTLGFLKKRRRVNSRCCGLISTPQQVCGCRGWGRENGIWAASSPASGLLGRKSTGFIYCLADLWMLRYLTPPLAP